jgi:hypothetical protein
MNILLRPLGRSRYLALINDRIIAEGKTPIFSAARQLQREGVSNDTILVVSHEGSQIVSMRISVGKAAGLTVIEKDGEGPRIATYSPMSLQTAVSLRSPSSHTAIVGRDDGLLLQTENVLSDDYAATRV